ncbi:hypothetical protein GCM10010518_00220 [Kitasatospora cinereorecta]
MPRSLPGMDGRSDDGGPAEEQCQCDDGPGNGAEGSLETHGTHGGLLWHVPVIMCCPDSDGQAESRQLLDAWTRPLAIRVRKAEELL